jgi:hypothetical protein
MQMARPTLMIDQIEEPSWDSVWDEWDMAVFGDANEAQES